MNASALHKISYGVYIVTSGQDGKFNGQIANSLFQVTSNPATVAISINKNNYTHEFIRASRKFVISVLSQEAPMTFIGLFGFKSGRTVDKLKEVKTKTGLTGVPIVLDYAIGFMEAKVENEMDCGTHTIFMGRVVDADMIGAGEPMTYAYYHTIKGGKSPKNAPTYSPEPPKEGPAKSPAERHVCTICGYEYDPEKGDPANGVAPGTRFEDIPDTWVCPVCGAGKEKFEKKK